MYGLGLVLVLITTGGIVAYWGDKIGRRIGKKRLSLFGLRPRHTSIVITIITGILISTATLTILAVVSQDVRTALFGMKELQQALANSRQRLSVLKTELTQKSNEVGELSRAITQKTEEYRKLSEKLLVVQKERDEVSAEYRKIQLAYEKTSLELSQAQEKAAALRSQLAPLSEQVERLAAERDNLLRLKRHLEREISTLERERAQLQTGLESMIFGTVVYQADEIVLSTVISGKAELAEIQNELSFFLTQANNVAVMRGAKVEGKQGIALKLLEGNFDTASQIIAELADEVVVRLISMTNVVQGEPVLTYFQILPKTKIWSAGQTIAACQIDGRGGFHQIQLELMDFLYSINQLAISRGMVTDSEGNVGDLTLEAFQNALKEISQANEVVTVEAIATRDIWTTRLPLNLTLKISK